MRTLSVFGCDFFGEFPFYLAEALLEPLLRCVGVVVKARVCEETQFLLDNFEHGSTACSH